MQLGLLPALSCVAPTCRAACLTPLRRHCTVYSRCAVPQKYEDLKAQATNYERHMLRAFGFVVHVEHPHRFILNYSQLLILRRAWLAGCVRGCVRMRAYTHGCMCVCVRVCVAGHKWLGGWVAGVAGRCGSAAPVSRLWCPGSVSHPGQSLPLCVWPSLLRLPRTLPRPLCCPRSPE